jgi:hypothetical protein
LKLLSIAWADSSRVAETLAGRLGAEFRLLPCPRRALPGRAILYSGLAHRTEMLVEQLKPDVVVVQHPPIHAVAAVAAACRRSGADFCIDAHSGAFLSSGPIQAFYRRRFARFGQQALVTLIHNDGLAAQAEGLGLNHLVLEMAVPDAPTSAATAVAHPTAVVIAGGGNDEPLEIVRAAARLRPGVTFHVTGRARARPGGPGNLLSTGFLTGDAYWGLLNAADAVIVLTRRESTILSGAYEGLAAARPLILSRTETLMRAFSRGAVLVENTADALAEGIDTALRCGPELVRQGQELRAEKARVWCRQFRALQRIILERRGRPRRDV